MELTEEQLNELEKRSKEVSQSEEQSKIKILKRIEPQRTMGKYKASSKSSKFKVFLKTLSVSYYLNYQFI